MLAALVGATVAFSTPCAAQAKPKAKTIETKSAQSRGATADPNVKNDDVKNKPGNEMAAPPSKGGDKSRGAAVGNLHVDNRTPWYIRIYVDGNLRGTLSPWGDWYSWGGCEAYALYAVARFDDGSSRTWGPVQTNGDCGDQRWTLRR
jgi:hypothetical protein